MPLPGSLRAGRADWLAAAACTLRRSPVLRARAPRPARFRSRQPELGPRGQEAAAGVRRAEPAGTGPLLLPSLPLSSASLLPGPRPLRSGPRRVPLPACPERGPRPSPPRAPSADGEGLGPLSCGGRRRLRGFPMGAREAPGVMQPGAASAWQGHGELCEATRFLPRLAAFCWEAPCPAPAAGVGLLHSAYVRLARACFPSLPRTHSSGARQCALTACVSITFQCWLFLCVP